MNAENNKINIIMAINEKFIFPTRVTIASLIANKGDELIDIYILHFNISEDGIKLLESDSTNTVKIKCLQICEKEIPDIKIFFEFSKEIMIKLYAYKFLPKDIDKVIWLDSDLIILKSLLSFYNKDIKGNIMIAQEEPNVKREVYDYLSLPNNYKYFNVGVMLINVSLMRKKDCGKEITDYMNKCNIQIKYPEQDIANLLYGTTGQVEIIGYPFCFNRPVNTIHKSEIKNEEIVVLHYIGFHQKPWKGCACRHYFIWWKYAWTIPEYRVLFIKALPKYLINFIKKIFVKIGLLIGIKKHKNKSVKI